MSDYFKDQRLAHSVPLGQLFVCEFVHSNKFTNLVRLVHGELGGWASFLVRECGLYFREPIHSVKLTAQDGRYGVLGNSESGSKDVLTDFAGGVYIANFGGLFVGKFGAALPSGPEMGQDFDGQFREFGGIPGASQDVGDGVLAHSERLSELSLCNSVGNEESTNFVGLVLGKFGQAVLFSLSLRPRLFGKLLVSAFALAVKGVISLAADEEVVRVDAARIVAGVENVQSFRDRAVSESVGEPVGQYGGNVNDTVLHWAARDSSGPWPAAIRRRLINALPERLDSFVRKFRDWCGNYICHAQNDNIRINIRQLTKIHLYPVIG